MYRLLLSFLLQLYAISLIAQKPGIDTTKPNPDAVQVDIWSYTDSKLQSRQLKDIAAQRHTAAADSSHSFVADSFSHIKAPDANVHIALHTWQSLDNFTLNGVLYKPKDFDSSKKYPLILYCGEKMPDVVLPSDGRLNIPSFVSNGYLVFVPDLRLKIGAPGQSVYNTVISAVNYLSKYSWVDTTKLGLQGFELGGYAANYLVTHTDRFAAICSAAGLSDLISAYGSLDANGDSWAPMIEGEPYRLGATLWDNPDLYIQNSPIFDADKVTTPLLMMHNKNDDKVPFAQAIELFTGLRRLQKEAWLLQYDDGGHILQGPSAVDFSIRMTQFFDHYLKGAPAPVWMTRGIPARMKGIVTGLELDR